jgi:hypothetical protein
VLYTRWNGNVESLKHRHGAGRPSLLNTQQIKQYILTPIKKKNKQHKAVHYTTLHQIIVFDT